MKYIHWVGLGAYDKSMRIIMRCAHIDLIVLAIVMDYFIISFESTSILYIIKRLK